MPEPDQYFWMTIKAFLSTPPKPRPMTMSDYGTTLEKTHCSMCFIAYCIRLGSPGVTVILKERECPGIPAHIPLREGKWTILLHPWTAHHKRGDRKETRWPPWYWYINKVSSAQIDEPSLLVPLGIEEMEESLGPGYGIGYWGWDNLIGRPDQCRVETDELQKQRDRDDRLRQTRHSSLEGLCLAMTSSGRLQSFCLLVSVTIQPTIFQDFILVAT